MTVALKRKLELPPNTRELTLNELLGREQSRSWPSAGQLTHQPCRTQDGYKTERKRILSDHLSGFYSPVKAHRLQCLSRCLALHLVVRLPQSILRQMGFILSTGDDSHFQPQQKTRPRRKCPPLSWKGFHHQRRAVTCGILHPYGEGQGWSRHFTLTAGEEFDAKKDKCLKWQTCWCPDLDH